MKIKYPAEF